MMKVKKLLWIPLLLLVFSLAVFVMNYQKYGDLILKDIDLRGGTLITIETRSPINLEELEKVLSQKYGSVIISGLKSLTGYGATIQVSSDIDPEDVLATIKSLGIVVKGHSIETVGPSLGEAFWQQVVSVLVAGFLFMAIMIYLIYRSPVPTFAIVVTSVSNILTTIAILNFFGIPISFPAFAALLMILSYTVDTNIVLTTKVLRAKKRGFQKAYKEALVTALKIIIAVIAAMSVMLLVPTSKVLTDIALILVVGLANDLVYTWILNAGILEIYLEGHAK